MEAERPSQPCDTTMVPRYMLLCFEQQLLEPHLFGCSSLFRISRNVVFEQSSCINCTAMLFLKFIFKNIHVFILFGCTESQLWLMGSLVFAAACRIFFFFLSCSMQTLKLWYVRSSSLSRDGAPPTHWEHGVERWVCLHLS